MISRLLILLPATILGVPAATTAAQFFGGILPLVPGAILGGLVCGLTVVAIILGWLRLLDTLR